MKFGVVKETVNLIDEWQNFQFVFSKEKRKSVSTINKKKAKTDVSAFPN